MIKRKEKKMRKKISFTLKTLLVLLITVFSSSMFKMNVWAIDEEIQTVQNPYSFNLTKNDSTTVSVPYTGLVSEESSDELANIANYTNNKVNLELKSNSDHDLWGVPRVEVTTSDNDNLQLWYSHEHDEKITWINALTNENKVLGNQYFKIEKNSTNPIDFYILANKIGTYEITFKLMAIGSHFKYEEKASQTFTVTVTKSHEITVNEIANLPFTGLSTVETFNPATYIKNKAIMTLKTINYSNIDKANVKVDVTSDNGQYLELWAKNGDTWSDVGEGYLPSSSGYQVTNDYNKTTEFYILANRMGDYNVTLSLVNSDDPTIVYATETFDFTIGRDVSATEIEKDALIDIYNKDYGYIYLYNPLTISGESLKTLKDLDHKITFNVINYIENARTFKYGWTFNGETMTDHSAFNDIDLGMNITTTNGNMLQGQSNLNPLFFNFDHSGELPGDVTITVPVDKKYMDSNNLWLYYFNTSDGKYYLEDIDVNKDTEENLISFNINHCSTYIVTTDFIPEAIGNPQTGDINMSLFICLGLFSLTGMALTIKKNILAK